MTTATKTRKTRTTTTNKNSRMQKGSGIYPCNVCGKKTRATGNGDNEHVKLCAGCYEQAGDENSVSDGHMTQAEFDAKWNKKAKHTKTEKKVKTPKVVALFQGTVPATTVFKRTMSQFKNCTACCWLLMNTEAKTYAFANSYNGDVPKASFDAQHYTYELTPKAQRLLDKKLSDAALGFEEIEVTDWPAWVTNAAGRHRKTRKASK